MRRNNRTLNLLFVSAIGFGGTILLFACTPGNSETISERPGVVDAPSKPGWPTMPAPEQYEIDTVVEKLVNNGSFQRLTWAIEATGLRDTLSEPATYTIFAPTDAAIQSLPDEMQQNLMKLENRDALAELVSYHIISRVITPDSPLSGEVATVAREPVTVKMSRQEIEVNNIEVSQPSIEASNGMIYPIDRVLLPPGFTERWNLN